MCGIIGYVGPRQALPLVLDGLRRMEYRGYDSAGVAIQSEEATLGVARKAGVLANLEALIDTGEVALPGSTGIGHTRWATHGGPTDRNAHPHRDSHGKIAVIHNGIIENFAPLRREIEDAGIELTSDTDTEVVAHLLAAEYNSGQAAGDLPGSMAAVCRRLLGAFTLVAVHADVPDLLVAARRNSPLVIGVNSGEGEMFVASDVAAFIAHTREAVELGQDQLVVITPQGYEVSSFSGGEPDYREFHVDWDTDAAEKGGFEYFMDKEIAEQPDALANTLRGHFDGTGIVLDEQRLGEDELRTVDKVFVVSCGSSYHAGLVAKYAIEHWTRLPVEVELASEFRYRDPVLDRDTLVIAISQSGETADTLEAVRHARRQRARVLAVCNTNGSQIPRESDAVLYTHAGPEIGVASTKAFLAQVGAIYLVGLALAQARGTKYLDEVERDYRTLSEMPAAVAETLTMMDPVRALGREIADSKAVLFLGRHVGYPVALEGALKLKELAYMHAEGFAAGELKHGPIALIEEGLPVVVVTPSPKSQPVLHSKLLSNIREIQARGARTIVIAEEGDDTVAPFADWLIELPRVPALMQPLVATVPLQVLAAEIARARGYDIDKPRNLAKSVTVE
ncbi:glutamine--fructose-6-phosphate transaminase (isomerizing) [Nakamurella silvestris]|nr:glutamine--fructose-6-phosphate transaminase (isomerizing) [Nakamurella silvestris]